MVGRAVVVLILALLVARSITGAVVTVSESDKDPLSVSLMLELSLVSVHCARFSTSTSVRFSLSAKRYSVAFLKSLFIIVSTLFDFRSFCNTSNRVHRREQAIAKEVTPEASPDFVRSASAPESLQQSR